MKRLSSGGLLALTALVFAGCPKAPEPKQLPPPPSIKSFTADRERVELGESVRLSFQAEHATEAVILDGSGTEIPYEGDANGGTATVTPTKTDVYVLKVTGEGGRDTDFTRVAVGEDLKEVFLTAVPAEVKAGRPVDLLWSAQNARTAAITSSGGATVPAIDPGEGSGVVTVLPDRSQTFTLTATGADATMSLTADAAVVVQATVDDFTAAPLGAQIGETITLHWTTHGADEVILSEALFGEQKRVTAPTELAEVDEGSFDFVVPGTLPSGAAVTEGLPLHFTLTVKQNTPERTITRALVAYVGLNPVVEAFVAPDAVTEGKPVPVTWKTANASKVQLFSNGQLIFETLPSNPGRVTSGSYDLPPIGRDLDLKLVATNAAGGRAEQAHTVALVKAPKILTFEMPASIANAGDPAQTNWSTQDASEIVIRLKDGPALFYTSDVDDVGAGTRDLYPVAADNTFVLEAFNAAGDKVTAEQEVHVFTPSQVTVSPTPAVAGSPITLSWAVDPNSTAEVIGIPSTTPIQDFSATEWLELDGHVEAREVVFSSQDDDIAELPLSHPFYFPYVDGVRDHFWVSTNGFVSFGNVGALPDNQDLTQAGAPEVIAPFWDDLELGSGKVLYVVDDSTTPRRLVIEWLNVHPKSDSMGALTFQVQLEETGRFRFLYSQLTGTDSGGENATIGLSAHDDLFNAQIGFNLGGALVAENSQITWFGSGSVSGEVTYALSRPAFIGFFTRQQGGIYQFHGGQVWVFGPGSLEVTEAMPLPATGAIAGQWVEIHNALPMPVNIGGLELTSAGATQPHVLPPTMLPANGYYVYGQSLVPDENGGAPVNELWSDLSLGASDSASIQLSGTTLASLSWTNATAGESVQPPDKAINSAGASLTCQRTVTFGMNGAIGTPGARNENCFPYALTPITVAFEDISGSGTPVFTPGSNQDTVHASVDLSAHPFTYFGQTPSKIEVDSNGLIAFGTATSSYTTNKTKPSTSNPRGSVAPFWDDLEEGNSTDSGVYYQYRGSSGGLAGRWIIQWHHFTHYLAGDDLNFEIKLFDDGAIEFHYATMTSGTSSNYATGNSATAWIENLAGDLAIPIGINQPVIQPDTAYRFTPNPNAMTP